MSEYRNKSHIFHILVGLLLVAISTPLVKLFVLDPVFTLPAQRSAEAIKIDELFQWHFWLIAFLFCLIVVLMLYALAVFRRPEGDDTPGEYIHGNNALEIAWTVLPLGFVFLFGFQATDLFFELMADQPDDYPIQVTAFQWGWQFQYPELESPIAGVPIASDTLYVPVDTRVNFELRSQDVIHAFWVPEFRMKQDLVPGTTHNLRVTPNTLGDYRLLCAELCGTGHAAMRADVKVVTQAEFDEWYQSVYDQIAQVGNLDQAGRGEFWYTAYGCSGCHSVDGSRIVGPTWQGIVNREAEFDNGQAYVADEAYLLNSILNPESEIVATYQNQMPANYEERMNSEWAALGFDADSTIADIIAYMETLSAE